MSVSIVVQHFDKQGKVPVDLAEVLQIIKVLQPGLNVRVKGVDVPANRIKGNCYRYQIPDSKILVPRQCALIVYSTQMELCEQRLVCAKELLHLLDGDPIRTSTQEQVLQLANELAQKRPASVQSYVDDLAKWQAVATLFPFTLWQQIMPRYKEDMAAKIAEELQIPLSYVKAVMTPAWEEMRESILKYA